jgi:hypothetical protein
MGFRRKQKMMLSLRKAQVVLLLGIVSASALLAQTATGEVSGTITDPNWAAVPGALVTLSNLTINSNATAIAPNVGRVTGLAQGSTSRQLQFGLRFVF